MRRKLGAFLRLGRPGMAPLTMSVPVLGALAGGKPVSTALLLALALLGLSAHYFGFGLNDIIDHRLDRTVPGRARSPLVSGALKSWQAWLFVLGQIPLALSLYYFGLPGQRTGSAGLVILSGSIGLSIIYNRWSKWGRLPSWLAEVALAASIGGLCLVGSWSQAASGPVAMPLSEASLLFAATLSLILLLLNSVPNGLKDLKTDLAFGAHSFVIAAGCRLSGQEQLLISKRVWGYSLGLQAVIWVALLGLTLLFQPPWWLGGLALLLSLYAGLHLRLTLASPTITALRQARSFLSGYYNYFALSTLLIEHMPISLQIWYGLCLLGLLALPWYIGFSVWRRRYQRSPF